MATIAGLPPTPERSKLTIDKRPARRGISDRRLPALGLRLRFRNGTLRLVVNPKGSRGSVAVVKTSLPGFTVIEEIPPFRTLGSGFRKADQLAVRLALRGHRSVTIR